MISLWRVAKGVAVALAAVVYLGLGYVAAAWPHPPLVALLVGVLPLAAVALASALQLPAGWRASMLALWAAAAAALVFRWEQLETHAALFYFVQHAGAMGFLAMTFGATLWAGHPQALCSRIARVMTPQPLDESYYRYTWQVTLAWTLFFVVMGGLSVALFILASAATWSLFANIGTPLLVGGMFVLE